MPGAGPRLPTRRPGTPLAGGVAHSYAQAMATGAALMTFTRRTADVVYSPSKASRRKSQSPSGPSTEVV